MQNLVHDMSNLVEIDIANSIMAMPPIKETMPISLVQVRLHGFVRNWNSVLMTSPNFSVLMPDRQMIGGDVPHRLLARGTLKIT